MLLYFAVAVTTTQYLHKFANFMYEAIQRIYVVCSREKELLFAFNLQKSGHILKMNKVLKRVIVLNIEFVFPKFCAEFCRLP